MDLARLVPVGEDREDGLVEASRQELHLSSRRQASQEVEGSGRAVPEPEEEAPRDVDGQGQIRELTEHGEEGMVRVLRRLGDHVVEVGRRLVVVDAEEKGQRVPAPGGITHGRGRGG